VTPAVTPIAAASAASAATATAEAAAATTTAASVPASTAATTALSLGSRLIHHERAAEEILAVERGDRLFCFRVVANFSESEAARLTSEAIAQQSKGVRLHSDFREQPRHIVFRSFERQISHVQFLHVRIPCA
jgi:hypothetical protein